MAAASRASPSISSAWSVSYHSASRAARACAALPRYHACRAAVLNSAGRARASRPRCSSRSVAQPARRVVQRLRGDVPVGGQRPERGEHPGLAQVVLGGGHGQVDQHPVHPPGRRRRAGRRADR